MSDTLRISVFEGQSTPGVYNQRTYLRSLPSRREVIPLSLQPRHPGLPRHFLWVTGRTLVATRVKLDAIRPCPVELCLEGRVLQREVGLAKIMATKEVASVAWESIPAHQVSPEPDALVVLQIFIVGVPEAEAVCRKAILVIDHLGVVALPADIAGGLDLIAAVLAGPDVLSLTIADPNRDVLPGVR